MADQYAAADEDGGGFPVLSFQEIHSKYYKKQGVTPSYELMVQILRCTSDELNSARRAIWPELRKFTEMEVAEGQPRQRIYELAFNSSNNMYLAGAIDVLKALSIFSRKSYCNTVIRDWLAYALATKEANDMKKNTNMQTAETAHLVEMTKHVNKIRSDDPHTKSPNKPRKKPWARCSISVVNELGVVQHILVSKVGQRGGSSKITDMTLAGLISGVREAFLIPANQAVHLRRIAAGNAESAAQGRANPTPIRSDDQLQAELARLYDINAMDMGLEVANGRS